MASSQSRYTGSSPRARGTRHGQGGEQPLRRFIPACAGTRPPGSGCTPGRRFIPACAGNTCGTASWRTCSTVHPRVRGEHPVDGQEHVRMTGSSPRARGTQLKDQLRGTKNRFIPACAGNTPRTPPAPSPAPVHPRVRGEHRRVWLRNGGSAGSSPRARGTRRQQRRSRHDHRFIPACAGNTL